MLNIIYDVENKQHLHTVTNFQSSTRDANNSRLLGTALLRSQNYLIAWEF